MQTLAAAQLAPEDARAIRAAAARHGIEAPRLFGSRVRGESGTASDLDLVVRLGAGRGYQNLLDFCDELERELGRRVDVVPEDGLSPFLRERVLAEAVPV
jgi:predicted nucleotidyltransferase